MILTYFKLFQDIIAYFFHLRIYETHDIAINSSEAHCLSPLPYRIQARAPSGSTAKQRTGTIHDVKQLCYQPMFLGRFSLASQKRFYMYRAIRRVKGPTKLGSRKIRERERAGGAGRGGRDLTVIKTRQLRHQSIGNSNTAVGGVLWPTIYGRDKPTCSQYRTLLGRDIGQ